MLDRHLIINDCNETLKKLLSRDEAPQRKNKVIWNVTEWKADWLPLYMTFQLTNWHHFVILSHFMTFQLTNWHHYVIQSPFMTLLLTKWHYFVIQSPFITFQSTKWHYFIIYW